MLDAKLKCWLLEVNHLPSFNSDTGCDRDVKYELLRSTLTLIGISVDQRKQMAQRMKEESKKIVPQQKRLSLREHAEKVRFDLERALKIVPNFKPIYSGLGKNRFHDKWLRKANDFWQMTTGTYKQSHSQHQHQANKEFKRKKTVKKIKKKGEEDEGKPSKKNNRKKSEDFVLTAVDQQKIKDAYESQSDQKDNSSDTTLNRQASYKDAAKVPSSTPNNLLDNQKTDLMATGHHSASTTDRKQPSKIIK